MKIKRTKSKGLLIAVFICLLISSIAYSGSIINSRHDLYYTITTSYSDMSPYITDYGEVCVYCHTPHGGNSQAPLWNRNVNTPGNYDLYNSTTMDNPPTTISGVSLACLSCHDGAIAVDEIINAPGPGANTYDLPGTQTYYGLPESQYHYQMKTGAGACGVCHFPGNPSAHDASGTYLTTNLTDDHPISMDYPSTSDFNAPPDSQKGWPGNDVKLFAGKVECASCHNVHDPDIKPFLRLTNQDSTLCQKCHVK